MFFLSCLLNKQGTYLFHLVLETDNGKEYLKRNFKKSCVNFFSEESPKILHTKKKRCMSHVNDNDNVRIKLDQ